MTQDITHLLTSDALLSQLRWRYAVKKFDATRKIAPDTWAALEESLVLAPSSFGLQPWRFYVVHDAGLRQQLVAASWNQTQVVDASHMVVFALKKGLGSTDVERFIRRTAEVRRVPIESLAGYQKVIDRFVGQPKERFDVDAWSARQVYLALGSFLTACAVLGIDTCPLEGIDPAKYDRILGIEAEGYHTLAGCAAGYRAADDKYASLPKVRYAQADVVVPR
ncbi:MAG: NAD(P)H-dependent oxidoreductase [Planctomycetes bacterium]|nr:NAD(P)H-dependent oxidoreductase [Planctomycetota bacterium]